MRRRNVCTNLLIFLYIGGAADYEIAREALLSIQVMDGVQLYRRNAHFYCTILQNIQKKYNHHLFNLI